MLQEVLEYKSFFVALAKSNIFDVLSGWLGIKLRGVKLCTRGLSKVFLPNFDFETAVLELITSFNKILKWSFRTFWLRISSIAKILIKNWRTTSARKHARTR